MPRLPTPGGDDGTWGDILNAYLSVSLAADGTLKPNVVGTSQIQGGAVTNAQLDGATQTSLSKADSSEQTANKGVAGGYASLDGSALLPTSQLPSSVVTSSSLPALTPAACAITTNVASLTGLPTIDGYTCVDGDIVLLTAQATTSQNGVWVVHSGAWVRPVGFPTGGIVGARTVAVIQGAVYSGSTWLLQTNSTVTIDTTAQNWVQQVNTRVGNANTSNFAGFPNVRHVEIDWMQPVSPATTIPGTLIQGHALVTKWFAPTTQDSQQADSSGSFLVDTGSPYSTTLPTVGNESDAVNQGNNARGYGARVIGHIAKAQAQTGATSGYGSVIDFAYGYSAASSAARDAGTLIRQHAQYQAEDQTSSGSGVIGAAWSVFVPQSIHTQDSLTIAAYTGAEGDLSTGYSAGVTTIVLETGQGASGLKGAGFPASGSVQIDVGSVAEHVTYTLSGDTLTLGTATKFAHSQYARVAVTDSNGFGNFYMSSGSLTTAAIINAPAVNVGQVILHYSTGIGFFRSPYQTSPVATPPASNSVLYVNASGQWCIKGPSGIEQPLSTQPTPTYVSGLYYGSPTSINGTSASQGQGSLRACPFYVPSSRAFSEIGVEITSAGSSGALIRLGIYADNGSGQPGSLVLDAGTIDGTVTFSTTPGQISISQTLSTGLYWLVAAVQGSPVTQPTVRVNSGPSPIVPIGGTTLALAAGATGYSVAGVPGALPGTFGTPVAIQSGTRVLLQAT